MDNNYLDLENYNPDYSDLIESDYEQSIFLWIDILGFSKIVDDDKEYNKLVEILKRFQKIFQENSIYETRVISDAILIEIKTSNHKGNLKKLKKIFDNILKKQFDFIVESNHFVRGGIAVGSKLEYKIDGILNDNNFNFISNGLARSYNLESNRIDWPLIGTDKTNLNRMQKMFRTKKNELFNLTHSFNSKGEDIYFLDYLQYAELKTDDYNKLLDKKIKEFDKQPKIKNKYIWLLKHFKQCNECEIPNNLIGSIL